MRPNERPRAGLVLGELIVVIAVLGALAMMATFAFTRYAARSRTSEMFVSLCRISTAAMNYYNAEHVAPEGQPLPRQFPEAAGPTPATDCCASADGKCPGGDPGWTNPTWQALHFSVDHDHYYRYEFSRSSAGTAAVFSAIARGDLDCDGDITENAFNGNEEAVRWGHPGWGYDESD